MRPVYAMLGLALASTLACGGAVGDARAQWVIHVRTDAPVPQMGDRVLVELLALDGTTACSGCRRFFGLAGATSWPFSFGVPDPGTGAPLRVRVRLFRSDRTDTGGMPSGGVPIDFVGRLPATGGHAVDVSLVLSSACAGVTADPTNGLSCNPDDPEGPLTERPLTESTGEPGPLPGSFALAQEVPCPRRPQEGMVCIPGGLFVRGDATILSLEGPRFGSVPERLVRLSPFAMDVDEMTVGAMRQLVAKGFAHLPLDRTADPMCTWSDSPEGREDLPVNCLALDYAREACQARGLALPTEAQWEFAAGGRTEERQFPWGDDISEACDRAVVGRGRMSTGEGGIDVSAVCRQETSPGVFDAFGPRPVGKADATPQGIRDLAGNLAEWILDAANSYDGSCGGGPRILVDPICMDPAPDLFLVRGGDWADPPRNAQTARRGLITTRKPSNAIGFRCVDAMR